MIFFMVSAFAFPKLFSELGNQPLVFCKCSSSYYSMSPSCVSELQNMLLKSSSAPIPNSWPHHYSIDCSFPESEHSLHLPQTRSFSPTTSKNAAQSFNFDTDFLNPSSRLQHLHGTSHRNQLGFGVEESDEVRNPLKKTCSELVPSSGLGKRVVKHEVEVEMMGDGIGSNGCGGHGSGWDSSDGGEDSTDSYYQKMIVTDPNNALLLGNYAKFLKEVVGDFGKAKEYLERAVLTNPGDGSLLSLYAELIWQTEKDGDRAEGYYDLAVQIAPHDCYVAASYAKFLWDAEEDEEAKEWSHKSDQSHVYPLTAASRVDPK